MTLYIFVISNLLVVLACIWAVLSPRVNDGLFGKFALVFLCFSAVACAGWAWTYPQTVDRSETAMSVAMACMAVRCYWIKRHARRFRSWRKYDTR
ncbi:hypothetical protein KVP10_08620 [Candidimonas humi]|uniref:Holin n=1 Tax=Candidimonas humi TaxID=683355 RepID=A0ABV8NUJ2_9BURK|nr:hypothetical protein [Candidimonas humi]MBV6304950.1 hypothetical protein [Candidimonas humi]